MILAANIIAFIGASIMVAIGLIKERKKILTAQCGQFLIMGVANLMLGGITGFVANMVSIVRNLWSLKFDLKMPMKLFFIALQIAISAPFNRLGLIGWLPIVAAIVFTFFVDAKDERVLKCSLIFGQILWCIYDISIKNYSAFAFDVFTIISTLIGIWRIQKLRKKRMSH